MEIFNLRLVAIGLVDAPVLEGLERGAAAQPVGTRTLWTGDGFTEVDVFESSALRADHQVRGPVIIEQDDTTTVVKPGWGVAVHESGNMVLTRDMPTLH